MAALTAYDTVRPLGDDPKLTLRKALHLAELTGELYMAFNKDTPAEIVRTFRDALEKIKACGTHQRIPDGHLK
jgi:hypothetical protein